MAALIAYKPVPGIEREGEIGSDMQTVNSWGDISGNCVFFTYAVGTNCLLRP